MAVGFYNPYTGERLVPVIVNETVEADAAGHVFIGNVEILDDK